MKFIHISDIHLGAAPDKNMPWSSGRAREIYDSFYSVLYEAQAKTADMVLISGDLFHRQPLKRELKELDYHFRKIAPIKVVIIAGNHDYIRDTSNYVNAAWSDNVYFITSKQCQSIYFNECHTCVYGFSYHQFEIRENLYDTVKPQRSSSDGTRLPEDCTHILLAHGGDEKHIPVHWQLLDGAGFDYIALGHIHKPQIFKSRQMAYSGALEPVDKNDEGPHGYIEGICKNHEISIKFVPWAKRNYVNYDCQVTPEMSWEEIKDKISDKIADRATDIYKISLTGLKDVDLLYDLDDVWALGNIVSVDDKMAYDFDLDSLYEANKGNLLGQFIEKIMSADMDDQMRKKVLYYGFNALYRTGGR